MSEHEGKEQEEPVRFDNDTFEAILDLAMVGDTVHTRIYNALINFVDNNDIKDLATFELEAVKAQEAWQQARGTSKLPINSTYRSAVSVVRNALMFEVSLFDDDGEMLGKTALAALIKAEKETGVVSDKALDKRFATINTQFANLLAQCTPEKQEEYARSMLNSMKDVFTKLGVS